MVTSDRWRNAPGTRGRGCARCVLSGDVADSAGHLVWIDCEMTGLELSRDKLIEVAVLITLFAVVRWVRETRQDIGELPLEHH